MDQIFFQDVIDGNSNKERDSDSVELISGDVKKRENAYRKKVEALKDRKDSFSKALVAAKQKVYQLEAQGRENPAISESLKKEMEETTKGMTKLYGQMNTVEREIDRASKDEKEKVRKTLVCKWPEKVSKAVMEVVATKKRGELVGTVSAPDKPYGDEATGYRIAAYYGDELCYTEALGWHTWTGGRWLQLKEDDNVINVVQGLPGKVREEILWHREEALESGIYDDLEHEIVEEWFSTSLNEALHVTGLLQGIKAAKKWLTVKPEEMDANDMLLNTAEGELLLGTGEMKEHRKSSYCTRAGGSAGIMVGEDLENEAIWDIEVVAPRWARFLEETFCGDKNLIAYVRRIIGYCATGSTREHKIFFFYGGGRNGKSVFMNVISKVIGDYASVMPRGMLIRGDSKEKLRNLAVVRGCRLLVDNEVGDGSKLDENFVKTITGGERIDSRALYSMNFNYKPTFKVVCCTNNKPVVTNHDYAIWERIALVPFNNTVRPEDRDHDLETKLMMEQEGILQWVAQGAREWNEKGLMSCDAVSQATEEYRAEEDTMSQFVTDNIQASGNETDIITKKEIFDRFEAWATGNGFAVKNNTHLGRELSRVVKTHPAFRQCKPKRKTTTMVYNFVKFLT